MKTEVIEVGTEDSVLPRYCRLGDTLYAVRHNKELRAKKSKQLLLIAHTNRLPIWRVVGKESEAEEILA